MIPIRCISCGKPVSAYFDEYNRRLADGEESKDILDDMGITRYCCRRIFLFFILGLNDYFSIWELISY